MCSNRAPLTTLVFLAQAPKSRFQVAPLGTVHGSLGLSPGLRRYQGVPAHRKEGGAHGHCDCRSG